MKIKRRAVTLIEMMIVMFLIMLITGVIAYNYRGSLDEGKAFKTKVAIEKIETILNLDVAQNPDHMDNIEGSWKEIIKRSPLVQNASSLTKDGWGEDFDVNVTDGRIEVSSRRFEEYKKANSSMFKE
jgi:type II secretory pathway pseudopilin PulG